MRMSQIAGIKNRISPGNLCHGIFRYCDAAVLLPHTLAEKGEQISRFLDRPGVLELTDFATPA